MCCPPARSSCSSSLFGSACASSVEPARPAARFARGERSHVGVTSAFGSPGGPAAVPEILDFRAPLVGGGTFDAAELAGTPVAIWFWAPW